MNTPNLDSSTYASQEKICRLVYPFYRVINAINRKVSRAARLEGIFYGVRRAVWRAKLGHLGLYSDISPGVIVKYPEKLRMGMRSCIGAGSFIDAGGEIEIGDFVLISHLVSINSMSHPTTPPYHRLVKKKTIIRDHAWIGASTVILEGVEIGEGAIVAAGAVVTKSVEPWTIVAGVPARCIRSVDRMSVDRMDTKDKMANL